MIRPLAELPGHLGESVAHLLLAALGWYAWRLAERWRTPAARFLSAPLKSGLATLGIGLPVMLIWSFLAGGAPHVEDALTLLTFVFAFRAIAKGHGVRAALLVGLTVAWKPWGVVALPMMLGLPRGQRRLVLLAIVIPALCWLPFILGDPGTLSSASHGFELQVNSPLHALGFSSHSIPSWWRGFELLASLGAACLAARNRTWMVAFAAGCTARLLLDPAAFDYYVAGLILATAVTERLAGLRPWRTAVLGVGLVYAQVVLSPSAGAPVRFVVLVVVLVSWLRDWAPATDERAGSESEKSSPIVLQQRMHVDDHIGVTSE